jgi:cytochrome P450
MATLTPPDHVPAEVVVDFDLNDHTIAADLQARLAELRDNTPVAWTPHNGGQWILTRYEDIAPVLRDPETFSSMPDPGGSSGHDRQLIPISYDPPEHTAYRAMVAQRFSPQAIRSLEDEIRRLASTLIDDFVDRRQCEFVADFARPLPSNLFLVLMGWPLEDAPLFNTWARDTILGEPGADPAENAARRAATMQAIFGYFAKLIEERRLQPQNDFTTELITGLYDGERTLEISELLRYMMLLMLGGLHTVQSTLSYSMIYFAEHPETRQAILDEPGRLNHVVEEMLRWEAPAWPMRYTLKPAKIRGVDIPANETLLLAVTAANHDESEFPNPDVVDTDRLPNRHLTFSAGPHRCIGSHLARLEIRVAFEEIHRRIPDYEIDPELGYKRHLGGVNGVEHLNLRW